MIERFANARPHPILAAARGLAAARVPASACCCGSLQSATALIVSSGPTKVPLWSNAPERATRPSVGLVASGRLSLRAYEKRVYESSPGPNSPNRTVHRSCVFSGLAQHPLSRPRGCGEIGSPPSRVRCGMLATRGRRAIGPEGGWRKWSCLPVATSLSRLSPLLNRAHCVSRFRRGTEGSRQLLDG